LLYFLLPGHGHLLVGPVITITAAGTVNRHRRRALGRGIA
jgi:hypothetical protein